MTFVHSDISRSTAFAVPCNCIDATAAEPPPRSCLVSFSVREVLGSGSDCGMGVVIGSLEAASLTGVTVSVSFAFEIFMTVEDLLFDLLFVLPIYNRFYSLYYNNNNHDRVIHFFLSITKCECQFDIKST